MRHWANFCDPTHVSVSPNPNCSIRRNKFRKELSASRSWPQRVVHLEKANEAWGPQPSAAKNGNGVVAGCGMRVPRCRCRPGNPLTSSVNGLDTRR
jgi:hypothetical protein